MALEPPPGSDSGSGSVSDPLERAVEQARREPFEASPQEWSRITDSIMDTVRQTLRPSVPILVWTPDGGEQDDRGSRTYVASRLVVDRLREVLQSHATHAPERIDLDVEDSRLRSVTVELVAAYGVDLRALGARVRAEVVDTLHELLGADPDLGGHRVTLRIVDVVAGDPNVD